jgi:hypothetical protein
MKKKPLTPFHSLLLTAFRISLCLTRFRLWLLIALCSHFQPIFSQETTSASVSSPDSGGVDTNYVKYYKDKLIIGLWQSGRKFDILIDQKLVTDKNGSAINYIANSKQVSGISLDYDILSLGVGYRSLPGGNARTGNTRYLDLGLNINTRSLRLENSFRRYEGFYDNNSAAYTQPFTDATPYFQNPSMILSQVKSKLIYTFNKRKFALGAAYANAKRQVRSKGSWLLIGNFYSLRLTSDSSFIPNALKKDYGNTWGNLHQMNVYAYSACFGGTYTLVLWKRFYFNFLASYGLESQFRHYYTNPENTYYWKIQPAGDWRVSLGYNGKRFFIRTSSQYDYNHYESDAMKFKMQFIAASFDFGYRFNFKAPVAYQKFRETKLYKRL